MRRNLLALAAITALLAVIGIAWIVTAARTGPSRATVHGETPELLDPGPTTPLPITRQPVVEADRAVEETVDPEDTAACAALDGTALWAGKGFSDQDPRFSMIAGSVRGHLPAALAHWRAAQGPGYADEAMTRVILVSVQTADRDLVIAALPEAPFLISTLSQFGWTSAAHEVVRARLADEDQPLPSPDVVWAFALTESAEPTDHALLARVLNRLASGESQTVLVKRLRKLPGFDWTTAVRDAWGARGTGDYADRQFGFAVTAAQVGVRDAFAALGDVQAARRSDKAWTSSVHAWLLTQPALGGELQPSSWYREIRDRLDWRDGAWHLLNAAAPPQPAAITFVDPIVPDPPVPAPPSGLSADADAPTIRLWIDTHVAACTGRTSIRGDDPLIAELAAVPPSGFAELLLAEQRHVRIGILRSALQRSIVRAARSQHRDLVIRALDGQDFLIKVILARGWCGAAAPTIRHRLADPGPDLSAQTQMVEALAKVGDPADHQLLRDALCRMRYGYWQAAMAQSLATMPGFDLEGAVRAAWRRFARSDYPDRQDGFAIAAARAGINEALPIAVAHATGGATAYRSGSLAEEARSFLAGAFGVEPDVDAISDWWSTARETVTWDAEAHRWRGPAPTPGTAHGDAAGF